MLGKLFKQEFKATYRTFLPMFGLTFLLAIINRFLMPASESGDGLDWVFALTMFLYVVLILTVFIVAFVIAIQRFYKNLLKDEGYLTLSLPVPFWQHILVKLATSAVWLVCSIAAALLSVFLMVDKLSDLQQVFDIFEVGYLLVVNSLGVSNLTFILSVVALALVGILVGILHIYASISLGHLWKQHRLLGAAVSYVAIIVVENLLMKLLNAIPPIYNILSSSVFWVNTVTSLVLMGVAGAVCYFCSNYILSHKLNLE